MSAATFQDLQIEIPWGSGGEVRTYCPQCAEHHRTRSKTLGVRVAEGIYHCFRCGWRGRVGGPVNVVQIEARRQERDRETRTKAIERVLAGCIPLADPAAEIGRRYLHTRLGAELPELPRLGFHPALPYFETGDGGRRVSTFPALVATVADVAGELVTVHRTYMALDGTGKAAVESPKKLMSPPVGSVTGCAVRLHQADKEVILAEGIETALALRLALGIPAGATVSAHGLATVELPASIRNVIIGADNDANGVGQEAARACRQRLSQEGRQVRVMIPRQQGTDWADVLMEGHP